jgi:hypothetical protein
MPENKPKARLSSKELYELDRYDRMVLFYRSDPVEACRDLLKTDLVWFQRIQLRNMWTKQFTLMKWGRGTSKTFMSAVFVVLKAMLFPRVKIGIIGPTYRQAQYIFDEIEHFVHKSPFLRTATIGGISRGTNATKLKFKNGSFIEALPVGADGGNKIRGRRYNCLTYDTMVLTTEGLKKIGDVVEFGLDVGIITRSGNAVKIERYMKRYVDKIVKIKVSDGYEITGSLDHPILVFRDNDFVMVEMKDIKYFDRIPIYHYWNFYRDLSYRSFYTIDEAKFMGLSVGRNEYDTIPPKIFESSQTVITRFLSALLDVTLESNEDKRAVYVIRGKNVISQVQQLLLLFGIYSKVEGNKLEIKGEDLNKLQLRVYGVGNSDFVDEYALYEIESIEKIDKRTLVYDISLEDEHTFFSNGFLSHNCMVVDEFAIVDPDTVTLVLLPMMAVMSDERQNQLVISSTPYFKDNHFYEYYMSYKKLMEQHPDKYYVSSYNFTDVLLANSKSFQISVDSILNALKSPLMTKTKFLMEYVGAFPDENEEAFYTDKLIDSCTPRGIKDPVEIEIYGSKDSKYIFGVDPAREPHGDYFALVILKIVDKKVRHLVKVVASKGLTFQQMRDIIRQQMHVYRFDPVGIYLGYGGGGAALRDLLAEPWSYGGKVYQPLVIPEEKEMYAQDVYADGRKILHFIKETSDLKERMHTLLKAEMEQEHILFPIPIHKYGDIQMEEVGKEVAILRNEMTSVVAVQKGDILKFYKPRNVSDDRLTALLFANYGAHLLSRQHDEPSKNIFVPVGFWLAGRR